MNIAGLARGVEKFCAALVLFLVLSMGSSKGMQISRASALGASINHCGTISSNETWVGGGTVHVLTCDVTVAQGVTLLIQQGAIVKVEMAKTLSIQGSLQVSGGIGNPVYFTSIRDDTGGDTNGDGASSLPAPGDWFRIEFLDSSNDANSFINYAVIRYGSRFYFESYGAVDLVSASPTIQNTSFTYNYYYAIRADLASSPKLSGNTYAHNGINGLAIKGGTITSDTAWSTTETAYFLTDTVSVGVGATLTVNPGVVVKFNNAGTLFVQGALRVLGTSASKVYFTSMHDDTVKGDTNNDGAASSPHCGDWFRIEFQDSSDDANSWISNAVIRYGSRFYFESYGAVDLVGASPTIQNTIFYCNQYYPIRADLESFPKLSGNTYTHNGINGIALTGGTIAADTTWDITDTAYFLIDGVAIGAGNTLTLNPGVVVKLNDGKALIVQGALHIAGTSTSKVYLTSMHDDTVKGDTNNDGANSLPQPGDWSRIEFQDSSDDASLINYAIIRYGGNYYFEGHGGIDLLSASPTIQNSLLAYNQSYAIRADLTSFPKLSGNTYAHNGINGFALQGGTIASNTTWGMTNTSYFVIDDVAVGVGTTLTVRPGVVVKFNDGKALIVQGALRVAGTPLSRVYFTSMHDDTVKGDTNNDGASSSPSPGNWSRIEFQASSTNSLIDYAVIRYAGGYYNGAIQLSSASPAIRNSVITRNQNAGILADSSKPVIGCNNITLNDSYGIYNATPATVVNAPNQWWGSKTGPHHPTLNPGGTGNSVSDGVSFKPWRTLPCPSTLVFQSVGSQDGSILALMPTNNVGGTPNPNAPTFALGDDAKNRQYRAILSFNTSALPDNATIVGVTLKISKAGLVGTNPFNTMGNLLVDMRKGAFNGNLALEAADFQAPATYPAAMTITNAPVNGWYSKGLGSAYFVGINLLGNTQFRLRFATPTNNNLAANYLNFYSGNYTIAGYRPQLIITYYTP